MLICRSAPSNLSRKLAAPLDRAMHSTTSPPPSTLSPTASCRWKRGRPVSAHHVSTVSMRDQRQPRDSTSVERIRAAVGAADEASISDALQHIRLDRHVHGVRFKPTVRQEAPHAIDTATSSNRPLELHIKPAASHKDYEHATSAEISSMESGNVLEDQSTLSDDTTMELSSDSDYAPSQGNGDDPNRQDVEPQETEEEEEENEAEAVEEHTDLDYQIPEDDLRAAMQASPNTRASFWSANMYRGSEDQSLSVHYCKTMEVAERVVQHFLKEKVLGFDIEWRPYSHISSIKDNASLIQLACENRIALFHISLFSGSTAERLMPPTLKTILESPDIYKVGVAVKGDFSRLRRYLGIKAQGVFELSRLHNLVELYATEPDKVSNRLVSLATQVHQHLQLPLYKGGSLADDPNVKSSVRESDWSEPLDSHQIHYAAADAYAGFRLYHMLEWKRKQLRPTPPTRGLCDYDSKARPKVPGAKKTPRKRKDVAKTITEETTSDVEQELEDGEEEEEGYETAPEELTYSPDPEDPREANTGPAAVPSRSDGLGQRRVGRVNLSWLRGPDPGYPSLPPEPSADALDAKHGLDRSNEGIKHDAPPAMVITPSSFEAGEEEDEFADPDLDEALQIMDLDDEGKLKEVPTAATDAPERGAARPDDTGNAPEMFDYNPLRLKIHETATPTPSNPLATPSDAPLRSPEYIQATDWASKYLQSTIPVPGSTTPSHIRATVPHLRAYHMWHMQQLSVDEIAGHLCNPALSHTTVTGYILQAVQHEQLEYDTEATREMMKCIPKANVFSRFRRLAEQVGYLG